MLERVHATHQGVETSIRKARDAIFWPQISNDIRNVVATCNVCQENQLCQQKETMHSQPIPKERFEIVSIQSHPNMLTLLERCRERKFKMNKSKFRFKMNAVTYHGHVISDTGLKADPSKVQAIVEMERPEDAKAVKRLLSMVNYLVKFCPHLSTVSEPLRNLTVDGVPFIWSESHEQNFSSLKRMLSVAPVLRYYSLDEEVTVEADSSDYGLGAVLLQAGQPVAFASRTLSRTERNYSQMEKECLAITFACNRFDQYLHGRDYVTILTANWSPKSRDDIQEANSRCPKATPTHAS